MELTTVNFDHDTIEKIVEAFTHRKKVEFAAYCAQLVINVYEIEHDSKIPRQAITAAKQWIKDQTKENKRKCKDAVYGSSIAATNAVISDDIAATLAAAAANAAAAAAASAATTGATVCTANAAATFSAFAAFQLAMIASSADVSVKKVIKKKIIDKIEELQIVKAFN